MKRLLLLKSGVWLSGEWSLVVRRVETGLPETGDERWSDGNSLEIRFEKFRGG